VRLDQNITSKQRLFVRLSGWNVFDLPIDPLGTGVCADRCRGEVFNSRGRPRYNYGVTPTTIFYLNVSLSRFKYSRRRKKNSGFDLTSIGWPVATMRSFPLTCDAPDACVANITDKYYVFAGPKLLFRITILSSTSLPTSPCCAAIINIGWACSSRSPRQLHPNQCC